MSNKLLKEQQQEKPALHLVYGCLRSLTDIVICIYMILVIAVMPFYNQEGYDHIGTDKYTFFKTISMDIAWVMIPLVILCILCRFFLLFKSKSVINWKHFQSLIKTFSVTDCGVFIFGVAVLISYLCSSYQQEAFRGTRGWYMGMVSQLTFVTIYFLISRLWKRRKWLPFFFLPVSGIVFLLGYLNRFGIFPIEMASSSNPSYISTIGNINWYCGYLVTVLFGGVSLLWNTEHMKRWQKILLFCYVGLGFATLTTQGSSSGILTLIVLVFVMFLLSVSDQRRMQMYFKILLTLAAACLITCVIRVAFPGRITYLERTTDLFTLSPLPVVIAAVSAGFLFWLAKSREYPLKAFRVLMWSGIAVVGLCLLTFIVLLVCNTCWPGSIGPLSELAFLRFTPEWGSNRGATWRAGLLCFWEQGMLKKLVGVGPDCMAAYIYNEGGDKLLSLVRESFGNSRLTNAHNEWLTMLVNLGLLGMLSYVSVIVSAVVRFLKHRKQSMIAGAAGLCVLAYSVNNIFSFQQSMSAVTLFVIMGIGEAYMKEKAIE